jgi:predicted ATPase/class 3 adenylate cyclase
MDCPSCGASVPAGRFCIQCGVAFERRCDSCGHVNDPGAKFCAECGHRLTASEPAPPGAPQQRPRDAERRQLTVMFLDLVGSTALSASLDPEDMREVIWAYQNTAAGEVKRYEGHVAKYMGDGVLAYFGWPQAHEDDAERAVRAGLAIVDGLAGLKTPAGAPLAARVGIATGLVMVGELIGEGVAKEQTVVGETPNLAARLQALAGPGSVVISQATRRLVGTLFELADLGPLRLKGFARPVPAWQVVGLGDAESRFEAMHTTGLTPLVGRDHELGLLLDRWALAKDGEGQVVLLSGEPGIGKSRITQAFLERLASRPHTCLRYYGSPYHTDSAFHPIIAQLERAGGFGRDDPAPVKLDKLEAVLVQASERVTEVAPLLAALLSIPSEQRYPRLNLTPQTQKARTFEALLAQFEGLASAQPVVMIFEDAHWIDPTTNELFALVIDRLQRLSILLLITFRPEFTPPWSGHAHITTLTLNRLGRSQGAAMVARLTDGKALPAEVLQQILQKTDGVPLFVEELTKTVLESGLLRNAGDRFELTGPLPTLAIPTTLHDSLMARLDRLASVKEVAQIGAVIGRDFAHDLLAAISPLPEDQLRDALDELVAAELIFRHGTPPNATYSFKHALVQDAAYGTLLKSRRQQLHARIAQALEERFPETARTQPALLAYHLTEAAETERAVDYWLKAGQRSAERSADPEAVGQLRRGLEVLMGLPESTQRDRIELEFQLAIGTPLIALSGWSGPLVAVAYERASALCERLGNAERLIPTLFGLASNRVVRGETRTAQRLAERCRTLAKRSGNPAHQLLGHRAMGAALMQLGALREARSEFERITELYDPDRDRDLAARCVTDPRASGLSFLSLVLWLTGYPDQAKRTAREGFRCAAELEHANTSGHLRLHGGAQLAELLRDVGAAREHADAVIALAAEHHMPYWRGHGTVIRGWVAAREGRPDAGALLVRQGITELDALGTAFHRSHYLGILARIHAELGDCMTGLELLGEAYDGVRRTEVYLWQAELHWLEGELLSMSGASRARVEACFIEALEVARRQEARSFELRAAASLARLWADQGKRARAHDLLAPVYHWFVEGFETADLKEAKALLDELK